MAQTADTLLRQAATRFCAARLPESVAADLVAIKPGTPDRFGTNLLTVAEAEAVLIPAVSAVAEDAFRAGFAAAEEVLGAHGSDHLLAAIETAWAGYADDNALVTA